jgi:hypothetical protein
MNWQQRFKGDFISAAELGDRRVTMTIARIASTKMDDEKKKKEVEKPVMYFKEVERGLIYCKTIGHCVAAMFGDNDDKWIGKRITIYNDPTITYGPDTVGGIRIAGSPDIPKALTVRIKFPKKKAFEVPLRPTTMKPADTTTPQQPAPPAGGGA